MNKFWSVINSTANGLTAIIIPVFLGTLVNRCVGNISGSIVLILVLLGYGYLIGNTFIK